MNRVFIRSDRRRDWVSYSIQNGDLLVRTYTLNHQLYELKHRLVFYRLIGSAGVLDRDKASLHLKYKEFVHDRVDSLG